MVHLFSSPIQSGARNLGDSAAACLGIRQIGEADLPVAIVNSQTVGRSDNTTGCVSFEVPTKATVRSVLVKLAKDGQRANANHALLTTTMSFRNHRLSPCPDRTRLARSTADARPSREVTLATKCLARFESDFRMEERSIASEKCCQTAEFHATETHYPPFAT